MALTGMQIYKQLPRTNCKKCGFPTCMAFAMQVAAKQKAINECPFVSDEAVTSLSEESSPPMKLVKIGTGGRVFETGKETVMFRHEEKFHHPCGLAVCLEADLPLEGLRQRAEEIGACRFLRVGRELKPELCALEICGAEGCGGPAERAKAAAGAGGLPLILMGEDPAAMGEAAGAVRETRPLIYRATSANIDSYIKIAADHKLPLAVTADSEEELADYTVRAKEAGVEEMLLSWKGESIPDAVRFATRVRRAALLKKFRPFGYPVISEFEGSPDETETVNAAAAAAKYSGIVILRSGAAWQLIPNLTIIQDIYTDPQVPNAVESRLYEIGNPGEDSPVMFTTNFSLTYYSVAGEVERSKIPSYICVVDTEGLGVLNSYAGDKISARKVIQTLKDQKVAEKVRHRKLIIPGLLPVFKAEIEEDSEWKEVIIGTESARDIPAFMNRIWGEMMYTVRFLPAEKSVSVPGGTSLLEAARLAGIELKTQCGGEGICGRCRMIIREGEIRDRVSWPFTEREIDRGYVLACLSHVYGDLAVEIPEALLTDRTAPPAGEPPETPGEPFPQEMYYRTLPVITKTFFEFQAPSIFSGQADHQLVSDAVRNRLNIPTMQMGLKIIELLPGILRDSGYKVTLTVGLRRDIAEIMNIEAGNTEDSNYMVVVDMGTTTVVAHLVNVNPRTTVDTAACYNSQSIYGSEVTARMIQSEKTGIRIMQDSLVGDINTLIRKLCRNNNVPLDSITGVVCAGNTTMEHFLLGLPTENIRRKPFIPVTVEPPPLRAVEVGLKINRRGLLYSLPGISGWVGSDLTAGILATGMHRREELSLLVDIGTNGEVIIGNREWLIAASASAGPALEGASVECGMRAEPGAVDRVFSEAGSIKYSTIGNRPPVGICGSGIMDLVNVLLEEKIINRSGLFIDQERTEISDRTGRRQYVLAGTEGSEGALFLTEKDIENIITAKAAIFAAVNILVSRLSLRYSDIAGIYIAGAFGSYLNIDSAIGIGLLPPLPPDRIHFAGNTSIRGAKLAAFYQEAFYELPRIRSMTTYYDLLGAEDYVEEFRKAMFLPHTDIDYWRAIT